VPRHRLIDEEGEDLGAIPGSDADLGAR